MSPLSASLRLCVLIILVGPALGFSQGTFYSGVWPGEILIMDEATGEIRGKIPLKNGVAFGMTPSPDRKKFYAITSLMEGIEVIDVESRQVVEAFKLSEGNRKVRLMRSTAVHPDGHRLFAPIRAAVKEMDRFTIEKPQLVTIDLREKKITKTLELPKEYSGNPLMRVSPDGKFLYFFFRDILVIDVEEFKIVDKIELDRPLIPGTGILRLGRSYEAHDEPGMLTFLFTSADPTTNRNIMGIARFNLADRTLDFFETNPGIRFTGFAVAPDRKRAYGVRSDAGLNEIYVYDLDSKRLIRKHEYVGRTRTALNVSSDGKKIYLHGAGNTIDYMDAETLTHLKSIELHGDFTTDLFVFPR